MTALLVLNVNGTAHLATSMRGRQRGQSRWPGVVKIQRGIDAPDLCLIYNESRTLMHQQEIPHQLRRMFLPNELKFYADATFETGVLTINNRAPAQAW